MKTFLKFLYAVIGAVLLAVVLGFATEQLTGRPKFCVSCHLEGGERLHAAKHKAFTSDKPSNLASAHRKKSVEKFDCITCHGGTGPSMKVKISLEEVRNTFSYFLSKFEEPKKIAETLMSDDNCEGCHRSYKGGAASFHGMKAHSPKISVPCIACHKAHPEGEAEYYFIIENVTIGVCRKCHSHLPPSFRLNGRLPVQQPR